MVIVGVGVGVLVLVGVCDKFGVRVGVVVNVCVGVLLGSGSELHVLQSINGPCIVVALTVVAEHSKQG